MTIKEIFIWIGAGVTLIALVVGMEYAISSGVFTKQNMTKDWLVTQATVKEVKMVETPIYNKSSPAALRLTTTMTLDYSVDEKEYSTIHVANTNLDPVNPRRPAISQGQTVGIKYNPKKPSQIYFLGSVQLNQQQPRCQNERHQCWCEKINPNAAS